MILRKKFGGIQEMYNIVSKLLIYGDMDEESILMQLSDIFRCMDEGSQTKDVLRTRVFKQVKRILEVATDYAFDKNLWHNYLTYLLITNEIHSVSHVRKSEQVKEVSTTLQRVILRHLKNYLTLTLAESKMN